jgi:hypothetical protein
MGLPIKTGVSNLLHLCSWCDLVPWARVAGIDRSAERDRSTESQPLNQNTYTSNRTQQ